MWSFPVAILSSLLVTVLTLRLARRWSPDSRMGLALAWGTAAGHLAWTASNEFSASSPESGWGEALRATLSILFSPREASQWVVPILLLLGVCELIGGLWRSRRSAGTTAPRSGVAWIRIGLWAVVYAGTLLRLLWGSVYLTRRWTVLEAIVTIAIQVVGLLVILLVSRLPGNGRVLGWRYAAILIASGAACGVIGMSGSAVFAQLLSTAVVSLLLCSILAWWERASEPAREWPIGMILLVISMHIWLGHYFAELSVLDGCLLQGAVAAGALFGAGGDSRSLWWNRVLPSVVSVVLSATAVGHAAFTLSKTLANPGW